MIVLLMIPPILLVCGIVYIFLSIFTSYDILVKFSSVVECECFMFGNEKFIKLPCQLCGSDYNSMNVNDGTYHYFENDCEVFTK